MSEGVGGGSNGGCGGLVWGAGRCGEYAWRCFNCDGPAYLIPLDEESERALLEIGRDTPTTPDSLEVDR